MSNRHEMTGFEASHFCETAQERQDRRRDEAIAKREQERQAAAVEAAFKQGFETGWKHEQWYKATVPGDMPGLDQAWASYRATLEAK